jgi:hypothetical protein
MKRIGLSLSFCIKDICDGKVAFDDVAVIITNTRANDAVDWRRLTESYSRSYWSQIPNAAAMADRLRRMGRIVQPRLDDPEHHHSIVGGWWLDLP